MGFFDKLFKKRVDRLCAPVCGKAVPLEEVPDPIFAQKLLGDGIAIEPSRGRLVAPCDAMVERIFATGHAVILEADCGAEILIHAGLDTINLGGKPFRIHCADGDRVRKGDLLIEMDLQALRAAGYPTVTPVVISNSGEFSSLRIFAISVSSAVVIRLSKFLCMVERRGAEREALIIPS